ncbi:MAG TPA: LemA family protein [Planctomycetes bacterium]|nr:LemA family protein [Planctomycetota bacterium]
MSGGTIVLLVVLAFVLILVIWFVAIYNGLVRLKNQVKNAWSQIDVQLKRRHDLIPNLVETVKGYASHEKETLERVVQARSRAMGAQSIDERIQAEGELGQALGRLMLLVESYPDLKANQNFLALQEELTSTENKISFARQFYNDSVMTYNNKIQMFPSNVIAGMFNFKEATFFKVENEAEREAPQVKF